MYIYILLKLFIEYLGLRFKITITNLFLYFEILIIFVYIYLFYIYNIYFSVYLLFWCLFWVFFFSSYRLLNYILINMDKTLILVEKKEKIKKFLLKPMVNKGIYYIMWSLPWNILYWIYFWVMENGWYFRVWVSSNRDIFFWKYFKWDSRDFFFKINELLFNNFLFCSFFFFKDGIFRAILRILILFSLFKKNILKITFLKFFVNRLFIFCYLSLFYLYIFENIYLFNKWILICLIFTECFILLFFTYIFEYLFNLNNSLIKNYLNFIDPKLLQIMIDPLTYKYYVPIKAFFETNNLVWNIILGDSITLNILKKYMIWVNKNTKGYYYKEMNILPKYTVYKLFEISSIPFDILPLSCYVIMQLRYVNKNLFRSNMPDYSLRGSMKNMYLSYFDKTYSIDSSILAIIFLLRLNLPVNSVYLHNFYKESLIFPAGKIINHIRLYQKSSLWRLRLAEITKKNPYLLDVNYFINSFVINGQVYDIETLFIYNFLNKDKKLMKPIITNVGNLQDYKKNIKMLTHFIFFEEEGIVWNSNILVYLNFLISNNNKLKKNNLFDLYKALNNFDIRVQLTDDYEDVDSIVNYYKISFNTNLKFEALLNMTFEERLALNLLIIDINFNEKQATIYEHLLAIVEDFETLGIVDISESRYYFLFEDDI